MFPMDIKERLREIPSVDRVLSFPCLSRIMERYSRSAVVDAARGVLGSYRERILGGSTVDLSEEAVARDISERLAMDGRPSMRKVINATGTVIHTNLGRSPLPDEAVEAVRTAATSAVNLEYDLLKGGRGDRDSHVEALICRLTGAEAATVVNNNAGAVLLVLNALARRKGVVVSRGELVEIGGSFRIPEIIRASGAGMVEVGTTNRTRLEDYEGAVTARTGALLKVHRSNYRITGFTESVSLKDLAVLGRKSSVPVVEDLGSGALVDLSRYGLPREPVVAERLEMGADVVTFSGDKLLGGPQAGIIAGKRALIDKMKRNPLKRALRVDKMTLAALEALLRIYLDEEALRDRLPLLRFLTRPMEELEAVADEAAQGLGRFFKDEAVVEVVDGFSEIGSGSLPGEVIATKAVSVVHRTLSPDRVAEIFRRSEPPIIGRISRERFLLDVRCVERGRDVVPCIADGCWNEGSSSPQP